MVQERREPVELTQDSPEPAQDSRSENSRQKFALLPWFIAISGFLTAMATVLTSMGAPEIFPELARSIGLKSSQEELQTESYVAVFKTRGEEPEGDEQLQLNFQDGNVNGSSISTANNVDKEWDYTGHTDGSYLALTYREKNTPVLLGTVLMRKRAEGEYIGYWEGKLCSDSNAIVRCPYALVKGNSRSSMSSEQESHLDKPCVDTVFDGNSSETSAGNPCS